MDDVFKALADASRRQLLDTLHKDNGKTLGQLCENLDMTRQAVTKHLVILEHAKLVVTVWRGREKLHYINPVPIQDVADRWIGKYERHRVQALANLKLALESQSVERKPVERKPVEQKPVEQKPVEQKPVERKKGEKKDE